MKVITTRAAVNTKMLQLLGESKSIGFVATMGALHQGHLELVRRSMKENDVTICSIFVNPLQFNNSEDLEKYPQTLSRDISLLEKEECHFLFNPTATDFYKNVEPKKYNFENLGKVMEAIYRPDHFEGVATVVGELFKAISPTRAYFGEKDYQQLAIVRWVVRNEQYPVKIIPCSTVRNEEGLALSSRNERLSDEGLKTATRIFEVMQFCRLNERDLKPKELAQAAKEGLEKDFEVEYLEVVDEESLLAHDEWRENVSYRVFIAANLEGVRLIDNLSLNP